MEASRESSIGTRSSRTSRRACRDEGRSRRRSSDRARRPVRRRRRTATLTRTRFAVDEAIRETTLEKMASLQPASFPTVSYGRQLVADRRRSAAVLIASEQKASELVSSPAPASRFRARRRRSAPDAHGNPERATVAREGEAHLGDIEVIEVNEAFASVVLQFLADQG